MSLGSQIRKNLGALVDLAGHEKKSLRWGLWRVNHTLSSLGEVLSHLPNKQDTWVSSAGKLYSLVREFENYTGIMFDHAPWFEVEADAKGFVKQTFPMDFLTNSPALQSVVARPRGEFQVMVEYTTTHTVFVPAFRNMREKGIVEQNDREVVYAKSEADFDAFVDSIWESYNNRVFVDCTRIYDQHWSQRLSYTPLRGTADDLVGRKDILETVYADFTSARVDGEMRVWLLLGKPGTGKTTFVQHLAERLGCRFMHLSYNVLASMGFEKVLKTRPDFLLLDDFDQLHTSVCKEILDRLGNLGVLCIITANNAEKFDETVLRPGRIDQIIEFTLPDRAERETLIRHFQKVFRGPNIENLNDVLDLTEGFGHVHCKEVGRRLSRDPYPVVVEGLKTMARLQKAKETDKKDEKPAK